MKTTVCGEEELLQRAAEHIAGAVENKADCVLALSYDRTLSRLYAELVNLLKEKGTSLKNTSIFLVADFEDMPVLAERINHELIETTDADESSFFKVNRDNFENYDSLIAQKGGIDLAVLNLGYKGQFGFNEPATPYSSLTHRQKLTESSTREFSPLKDGLPEYAYTMGVKTIVGAKDIVVVATGEDKSEAVFGMLYGRDDSTVPAAFLQLPINVEVYADTCAASKL